MESAARKICFELDDSSASSPESLALQFAGTDSLKNRKKSGVFYTPVSIADEILDATLGAALKEKSPAQILQLSVLDPACGSGIFLIRALRMFLRKLSAVGEITPILIEQVLRNCLFGVDRDANAVSLARKLLLACARQYVAMPIDESGSNIRSGNSLLSPETCPGREIPAALNPFSWRQHFPNIFAQGGFNFVIGNPPYGLSRGEQICSVENNLLQQAFQSSRNGKINKYLAFIALGYQLLRSNGELSFIVPNAWLGIQNAAKLRAILLRDRALHSITVYDFPVFADPSVEAVVFKVKKDSPRHSIAVSHRHRDKSRRASHIEIPVEVCLAGNENKIPLLWDAELAPLLSNLRSHAMTIGSAGSPFAPMIALQAYAMGKGTPAQTQAQVKSHCFHSNSATGPDSYPYLEGGDIGRYKLEWSGTFLRHGKFLAEPQVLSRFMGPRVLLREILNAPPNLLSACYTDATYLYNKSVLHIIAKEASNAESMQALCSLLNSSLISFFMRMYGCKSQRKLFPKVVSNDLRSIPLSSSFFSNAGALAALCRQQMTTHRRELDLEIDNIVFDIYNIDRAQREMTYAFLQRSMR